MKFKSIAIISFLAVVTWFGCVKNTSAPITPTSIPTGNYIGTFTLVHLNPASGKTDTSTALITLALNSDLTYSVAGDTSKIQAGSQGNFQVDDESGLITFTDKTITKKTNLNAPKKHLNGPYIYTHSDPNLHIYGSADTLSYDYALKSY